MTSKLDIYQKLLKIQPWFQRAERISGGRPHAYRTYRRAVLHVVGGMLVETEASTVPASTLFQSPPENLSPLIVEDISPPVPSRLA